MAPLPFQTRKQVLFSRRWRQTFSMAFSSGERGGEGSIVELPGTRGSLPVRCRPAPLEISKAWAPIRAGCPLIARQRRFATPAAPSLRGSAPKSVLAVRACLRNNKPGNRVFDTCKAVVDARADAWLWPAAQPERITAIDTRKRARVSQ